jgi:hypothetical protein
MGFLSAARPDRPRAVASMDAIATPFARAALADSRADPHL